MKELFDWIEDILQAPLEREKFLLVGNAFDKSSLFVFGCGDSIPRAVARVAVSESARERCAHEYNHIRLFRELAVPGVDAPRNLADRQLSGSSLFLYQAIVSDQWQRKLPLAGMRPPDELFRKASRYLAQIFHASAHWDSQGKLSCFQHGDFWVGNIGESDGKLIVYDLEYASAEGFPLIDLFHFSLYCWVAMRNRGLVGSELAKGKYQRADERREFLALRSDIEFVFMGNSIFSNVVKSTICDYMENCGISVPEARNLLHYYVEFIVNGVGVDSMPGNWHEDFLR